MRKKKISKKELACRRSRVQILGPPHQLWSPSPLYPASRSLRCVKGPKRDGVRESRAPGMTKKKQKANQYFYGIFEQVFFQLTSFSMIPSVIGSFIVPLFTSENREKNKSFFNLTAPFLLSPLVAKAAAKAAATTTYNSSKNKSGQCQITYEWPPFCRLLRCRSLQPCLLLLFFHRLRLPPLPCCKRRRFGERG